MQGRFSGAIGEEYELFKLACPHFDELEGGIGDLIKEHYQSSSKETISALEIGCGPGYTTDIILSGDKRIKVTAVDNEPVMIKQAGECLDDYINDGRVELFLEDGLEHLRKITSNSYDFFASAFTLHNFKQEYRQEVLQEIFKILKPEGLFLNADKYAIADTVEHQKHVDWQVEQFKEKYESIGRPDLRDEWITHFLADDKPEFIMKEQESIDAMQKIGFRNVYISYRMQGEALMVAFK